MGKLLHACVETGLLRWAAGCGIGGGGRRWERGSLEKRLAAGIVEERSREAQREGGREGRKEVQV